MVAGGGAGLAVSRSLLGDTIKSLHSSIIGVEKVAESPSKIHCFRHLLERLWEEHPGMLIGWGLTMLICMCPPRPAGCILVSGALKQAVPFCLIPDSRIPCETSSAWLCVIGNFTKMPRSFLVKKHFSATKKPNYSELESQTVYISPFLYDKYPIPVIPQSEILSTGAYFPPLVWDTGLLTTFFTTEPDYSKSPISTSSEDSKPLDLTSFSSEDDEGKTSDPPSPASSATEAEKFHCNQCTKSYSTFAGLSKHKQLHCDSQSRKSFSCKYCEKEYVSLGALKMHIRSHTLPCVCKICGKAFSRPWLLQGHIRTHTGEKPFSCTHCNRAFADRSNLRAHLQTHSDVKKYQCKTCSRTFSRMSLLHKHEETGCSGNH